MAKIVHTHSIGTQGSATVDCTVEREGQFLHQLTVSRIHFINNALGEGIGTLYDGIGIGTGNVDIAIAQHRSACIGVAVRLVAPLIGRVDTVLNPHVLDADSIHSVILHAIGHSP